MFFERRRYRVKEFYDIDDLAKKLTETTSCHCTGFKFSGVWFLNDASSEDGAQEYAAVILRRSPSDKTRMASSLKLNLSRSVGVHLKRQSESSWSVCDTLIALTRIRHSER